MVNPVPPASFVVGGGSSYRKSNFQSQFGPNPADTEYVTVSGTGVQKTLGWKKLPFPQKNSPKAYSRNTDQGKIPVHFLRLDNVGPIYGGTPQYSETQTYNQVNPWDYRDTAHALNADYKARRRLFDKLKGEGTNIANMLAERKQTIKSVSDTVLRLIGVVTDLKRGNIESAVRRLFGDPQWQKHYAKKLTGKDVANQFIALRYGWIPLLDDVYGLVEGLHKRAQVGLVVFRASGSSYGKHQTANFFINVNEVQQFYDPFLTRCRIGYMVRARPNHLLIEPAALGVTNPLVPLWEILPWSFVVDWFLPIGQYLEQLSADHGWNFYDGCVSTKWEVSFVMDYDKSKMTYISTVPGGINAYRRASCKGNGKSTHFSRSLLTGFPIPKLPRFKNPISTGHLQNSLALMRQRFK